MYITIYSRRAALWDGPYAVVDCKAKKRLSLKTASF